MLYLLDTMVNFVP